MRLAADCLAVDCEPCQGRTGNAGNGESPVLQIKVESSMKTSEVKTVALCEGFGTEEDIGVGPLLQRPLSYVPPHTGRGGWKLEMQVVATRPYYAQMSNLNLSVGVRLSRAFTDVPLAEPLFPFESELKHILVVVLFRLNTYAMNCRYIVCCSPLTATHYGVVRV